MNIEDVEKLYVGEYSPKQKVGYIETLEQAIRNNRIAIYNNTGADYLIIAIDKDYDKVADALDELKRTIENKEKK